MTGLSRRALLAGAVAGAVVACTGDVGGDGPGGDGPGRGGPGAEGGRRTGTPIRPPSATPSPAPPPYQPAPGEALLEAKRLAGRVAVALTSYAAGEPAGAVVARALAPTLVPGSPPAVAVPADVTAVAAPLLVPAARSAGRVVYPQLGGESSAQDRCAVLVVTEQRLLRDAAEEVVTRTIDVRLRLGPGGAWAVEGLASAGGDPVARPPDLPPAAAAVLDDPRIALPDTARWDVHAGRVDERLLAAMRAMAGMFPYGVTCLVNGHPQRVFGTDRTSNHTGGRAVDVWRVGDLPVVAQPGPDSPARRMQQALFDLGEVQELGGPWDLDGGGGRSFTDRIVHHDHLHVAFHG